MRKLGMLLAVAMLAFGVSGTANAALLNYHGTLTLELGTLPSIPAIGQRRRDREQLGRARPPGQHAAQGEPDGHRATRTCSSR